VVVVVNFVIVVVVVSIADDGTDAVEDAGDTIAGLDDRLDVFVSIVEVIVVSLNSVVVVKNKLVRFAFVVVSAALF
jgi:hypothetical protein